MIVNYTINVTFYGVLKDSQTDEVLDRQTCTASYTGTLDYADSVVTEDYVPLEEDVVLSDLNVSGRYTGGDFNIAFYTVPLDDDVFIIGPGNLLSTEFFTDDVRPMDLDLLCGTFTPVDVMTDGPIPGHFMQGLWYDMYGTWFAIGTALSVYKEDGSLLTGLAVNGTITISREGDDSTVVFDLVTPENNTITGSWTGPIADFIEDWTYEDSMDEIGVAPSSISGGFGCINAPADVRAFTLSGQETGLSGLTPGLYLVRHEGRTVKVIVR